MDQRQELLNKLNSVQTLPEKTILKFEDLEVGKSYIVHEIRGVNTRYGRKILLELDGHIIFLPQRFNVFDESEIQNLNQLCDGKLIIVKGDKYNLHFI